MVSSKSCCACFVFLVCFPSLFSNTVLGVSQQGQILLGFGPGTRNFWNESDETPCRWVGVRCDEQHFIDSLAFPSWNIPVSISVVIRRLVLLTSLQELDLSSNPIFGEIPEEIGNFTNLTRLDLSLLPHLHGSIPCTINKLSKLRYLSVARSNLSGTLPTSLDGLIAIQSLNLSGNQLTGSIPALQNLTSLLLLDLSYNNFTGSFPSLHGRLDRPVFLRIQNNRLTGFTDAEFPSLHNATQVDLSNNQLGGRIPSGFHGQVLNLASNNLSGEIPHGMIKSPRMDLLDLSGNHLSGNIPADLLQSPIQKLNLSHNLLVGNIPEPASNYLLSTLSYSFDLSDNQLNGPIPKRLAQRTFQILRLQNNNLSGDIQDLLDNCVGALDHHLSEVRLHGNQFTGDIAGLLLNCQRTTSFSVLDLRYNRLTMTSTTKSPNPLQLLLEQFDIQQLLLAGNNLTTISLPPSLNKTTQLQSLDLSNSNLDGELSARFLNSTVFPFLTSLNLSKNRLFGALPKVLPSLLTMLNLSNNRLSGQVNPSFILNLANLDVCNNQLSGPLPPVIPPSLWNPAFFSGNPGLCGPPLPVSCNSNPSGGVKMWLLWTIISPSLFISIGSCVLLGWTWRVYSKKHQQDADLIATLLDRDAATLIPLRELQRATSNFDESSQIGVGGFGIVYKGKLGDGTTVAIKRSKRVGSMKDKLQFLNEVRILSQLNHRHLVKLLGCCLENKVAALIFEYVPNGTVSDHLRKKKGKVALSWRQRILIALQTADALSYLHSAANPPVFHRDVKPANILLDEELNAKVADFGISKLAPLEATHVSTFAIQGTLGYIDPEYFNNYQITDKSDVYSFGVVLLELISAQAVVDMTRGSENANLCSMAIPIIKRGDLHHLLDPALISTFNSVHGKVSIVSLGRLAVECLASKSKNRPSMKEVWRALQTLWQRYEDATSDDPRCMERHEILEIDSNPLLSESSMEWAPIEG